MSKIDCSKTENFLRELGRATSNCSVNCFEYCPIGRITSSNCTVYMAENPKHAIELIQKWSDAHPLKTRLDDLKEKYPDFRLINDSDYPSLFPRVFGYCDGCQSCHLYQRTNRCESCWNEPVEGGATGQ